MTHSPLSRLVVTVLAAAAFAADHDAPGNDELTPLNTHPRTSVAIVDRLRQYHFRSQPLDDATSSEIFDKYLDQWDPQHTYFLASDVAALEKKYRTALDDALERGDLAPAFEVYNVYRRRALERVDYELTLLGQGVEQFDFDLDEAVPLDRTDAPPPATRADAENLWRLALKSSVLSGKLAGEPLDVIGETLTERIKHRRRMIRQTRSEEVFEVFVNVFANTYDEHTQYLSPRAFDEFNIRMSLSLQGIGAVLDTEEEYTVVERLVAGGPADRHGELQPSDRIVAVSQSAKEPFVDIVGWRTLDVVQLIRGPKGSPVLLKVLPAGVETTGETRIVEIVRDVVHLEDQASRQSLLTVEQGGREYRIGVVAVPTFYQDFEARQAGNPDYRSTTRDIKKLIEELKNEGIDGLIVDVRNNGGGSLQEAVELAGLFVESGPVVQVANLRQPPFIQRDDDPSTAWNGPLAVMVNGLSASSSEIFAGAIQDYGLGLVVGSKTFGKGTVQTLIDLQNEGRLKLTAQRYFRVSGEGTEYNGIVPDIAFPALESLRGLRPEPEGALLDNAVPPARFRASNRVASYLPTLRSRHQERANADPEFAYLRAHEEYAERSGSRTHLSLKEDTRRAEKKAFDAWRIEVGNDLLIAKGEEPVATVEELKERREAAASEEEGPEADAMVVETANILIDMINLSRPLASAHGGAPGTPELFGGTGSAEQ